MENWMSVTEFLTNANPEPGDMIEFNRAWYYNHWAMMSDEPGYVINICAEGKDTTEAWIRLELLPDVAKDSKIRINNKIQDVIGLEALTGDEAVAEARKVLDTLVPYDFKNKNCEYYVTEWKYGQGWSDQVNTVFQALSELSLVWANYSDPPRPLSNLEIENPQTTSDRKVAVELRELAAVWANRASQHDVRLQISKSLPMRLQNNGQLVSKKEVSILENH